jgi:hypothetical protein
MKIIGKHMGTYERHETGVAGGRGGGYYIDKPPSHLPLFLSLFQNFKMKLQLKLKYLFNY